MDYTANKKRKMKFMKMSKLFTILMLLCLNLFSANLFGQECELQTASDGFQWYLCTDGKPDKVKVFTYDRKKVKKQKYYASDINGNRITPSFYEVYYNAFQHCFECQNLPLTSISDRSKDYYYSRSGQLIGKSGIAIIGKNYASFSDYRTGVDTDYALYIDGELYTSFLYDYIKQIGDFYVCYYANSHSQKMDIYKKQGLFLNNVEKVVENDGKPFFGTKDVVYDYKGNKIVNGKLKGAIDNEYLKIEIDGKLGLYDFQGNKIVDNEYYNIEKKGDIFLVNTSIIDGYGVLDLTGQTIVPPVYKEIVINPEKGEFYMVKKTYLDGYGIVDLSGKTLVPPIFKDVTIDTEHGLFKVRNSDNKYGMFDFNGNELLLTEFQDCKVLNDDAIGFKTNNYWGVMNMTGKVFIPTNRQYTKIEYNQTFKTYYFEKEGGYKGECNAKGIQTSISKPMETVASNTKTTKTSSSTSNSKGTNGTSSSTSKATSNNNEPGLLYRGEYTISEDVGSTIEIISIYEDRIVVGGSFSFDYKSTNSKGNRVYSGNGPFGVYWRFYVSPNYNIRLTKDYPNPFGGTSTAVNCRVTKGQSSMPVQNGGEYYGGSEDYSGTSGGNKSGTSGNPVQPHQITESCPICHGSGKCNTCNGTHRYLNGLTGKYLECPNCKPDGRCTHCGGSGKVTKTKYY